MGGRAGESGVVGQGGAVEVPLIGVGQRSADGHLLGRTEGGGDDALRLAGDAKEWAALVDQEAHAVAEDVGGHEIDGEIVVDVSCEKGDWSGACIKEERSAEVACSVVDERGDL